MPSRQAGRQACMHACMHACRQAGRQAGRQAAAHLISVYPALMMPHMVGGRGGKRRW